MSPNISLSLKNKRPTFSSGHGFSAVCTTDFIQGSLMFVVLIITSIVMMVTLGGPAAAYAKAGEFSMNAIAGKFGELLQRSFLFLQNSGCRLAAHPSPIDFLCATC